jgi:hypothetical protein
MFYQEHFNHPAQPLFEGLRTTLHARDAILALRETILGLDPDASMSIGPLGDTLRWTSQALSEAIEVTALEEVGSTGLWFECEAVDEGFITMAKASFPGAGQTLQAPCPEPKSALEVLESLMTDPTWSRWVEVLPEALESASNCPFQSLDRLKECLERLAAYASLRATHHGRSAEDFANQVGLGSVYRPHISATAVKKYGHEYTVRWNGRPTLLREHLTIGGSCNDRICMSVHFIWDAASSRVVLGHVGRHNTCSITNT